MLASISEWHAIAVEAAQPAAHTSKASAMSPRFTLVLPSCSDAGPPALAAVPPDDTSTTTALEKRIRLGLNAEGSASRRAPRARTAAVASAGRSVGAPHSSPRPRATLPAASDDAGRRGRPQRGIRLHPKRADDEREDDVVPTRSR